MGAHYKNGVPIPISQWEGSWAYEEQRKREAKELINKQERERYEHKPKRHRLSGQ